MKAHFYNRSLDGLYGKLGGNEFFRRLSRRFHHKVERDPTLLPLFQSDMARLEQRLASYLVERTGGPPDYSALRGKNSLHCRHAHLAIGTTEAERWLELMAESLREEGVQEPEFGLLLSDFKSMAASLSDPLLPLYSLSVPDLRLQLEQTPELATINDHGRNLLCAAAVAWDVPRLQLLLEFGADIHMQDHGGHNALYRVANGGGVEEEGVAALKLLIRHGANVRQTTGVGGMTPLHMAARRGTVSLANALLAAGALVEARDKKGETPLRRAVNCGKLEVLRLLLEHGADPSHRDRSGQTPLGAARHPATRELLERFQGV